MRRVLTEEDRRKRRREACARYRAKHRDKCRATNAAWYKANPEKAREYARAYYRRHTARAKIGMRCSRYRIKRADYLALLEAQGNACAICRTPFATSISPHTDHDHLTNVVRGLLCQDCNLGLGRFKDSSERLIAASNYLLCAG